MMTPEPIDCPCAVVASICTTVGSALAIALSRTVSTLLVPLVVAFCAVVDTCVVACVVEAAVDVAALLIANAQPENPPIPKTAIIITMRTSTAPKRDLRGLDGGACLDPAGGIYTGGDIIVC